MVFLNWPERERVRVSIRTYYYGLKKLARKGKSPGEG